MQLKIMFADNAKSKKWQKPENAKKLLFWEKR